MMNDESPKKPVATKRKTKATKFKKAPQAPKRFKSAFMLFSTMKHPEIRLSLKDDENANVPRVAKLVAEAWRNLSPEERAIWDKRSSDDKKRYEVEKAMYTGPWKIPASKRARKDPNAPKRPMSAFLAYSQKMRSVVKQDNQHLSNTEISKLLADMWRDAPDDQRREYIEQESTQREQYKIDMDDWRSKQEEALLSQRKQREQIALDVIANGGGDEEIRKHRQQMAAESAAQQQQHSAPMYPPQSSHSSRGPPPQYSSMEPPRDDPSRGYYAQQPYYSSYPPPSGGYSNHYPPYQEMPGSGGYSSAPVSWGPEAPTSSQQHMYAPEHQRRSSDEHGMAPVPSSHYNPNYDPSYYQGSESSPGDMSGHPASTSSSSTYERSDPVYSYSNSQAGYNQGGYQHSYYG